MSIFKYKSHKLKYNNNIETLECKHNSYLDNFKIKRNNVDQYTKKINALEKSLQSLNEKSNDIHISDASKLKILNQKTKITTEIDKLKKEIDDITSCDSELNYYTKTCNILFDYYDIIDNNRDESSSDKASINDNVQNISQNNDPKDVCKTEDGNNNIANHSEDNIPSLDNASNIQQNDENISSAKYEGSDVLNKLNKMNKKAIKPKKPTKKRLKLSDINNNVSITKFLDKTNEESEMNDSTENNTEGFVSKNEKNNRASLFNHYMNILDPNILENNVVNNYNKCIRCKKDQIVIFSDGINVCTTCGFVEQILINYENNNFKDFIQEKPVYPYKRLNHLCEWISQFQAKESTDIPKKIYDKIYAELHKNKISSKNITSDKIREILRKLRLNQYYEHIPHIMSKITGKPPPTINREIEEKLKIMFRDIQAPFAKHCPKNRINFLSYSYVLHKMFQLLHLDDFLVCFRLLKSRDKLKNQDFIWKKICEELGWDFHPSV